MGYKKQIIKGVSWLTALRIIIRSLTFVRLAILARLLMPTEFGLFGIASLALAFLEIITETGINVFFIQDEGNLEDYLDTAFLLSIFRGVLISSLILLFTPLISNFFNAPDSKNLLCFIALIPFIRGFINPSVVRFQKELEFGKEFFLRSTIFLVDSLITISTAFILRSAYSLVWGMIAGVIVEVFATQLLVRPRPEVVFSPEKLKKVFNRGKWVTFYSFLQYLFTNTDSTVVGRLMSSTYLGYYQMAYKISTLPITEISNVFYNVTFPVFSKFQNDKKRLKSAFFKSTLVICLFVIPIGLAIFFFSDQIVEIVLGENWFPIIKPLKILSIYGIIRAITAEIPAIFLALKKQEYVTFVTFVAVSGILISIFPLVKRFGIDGAAYSALFGMIVVLPLMIYYLYKLLFKDES